MLPVKYLLLFTVLWELCNCDCVFPRTLVPNRTDIVGDATKDGNCAMLNCASTQSQACLTPSNHRIQNRQLTLNSPLKVCCKCKNNACQLLVNESPISSAFCGDCGVPNTDVQNFAGKCDLECQNKVLVKSGVKMRHVQKLERKMKRFQNSSSAVNSIFLEGDIIMAADKIDSLTDGKKTSSRKIQRNLLPKWKTTIYYEINLTGTDSELCTMTARIISAIDFWEQYTCLEFEPYDGHDLDTESDPILNFINSDQGCWSFVGVVPREQLTNDRQPVGLQQDCLWGAVVHEIGHALGMFHEHSRSDRYKHITLNFHLIAPDAEVQFYNCIRKLKLWYGLTGSLSAEDREGLCRADVPYCYGSIMHYPGTAALDIDLIYEIEYYYYYFYEESFAIETRYKNFQRTIGTYDDVCHFDTLQINMHYCIDSCVDATDLAVCQNGGYVDPDNCHNCVCCDGFEGDDCSSLVEGRGEHVTVESQEWTTLEYNFDHETHEPGNCYWLLETDPVNKIEVKLIGTTDLDHPQSFSCQENYVSINAHSSICMPGFRNCGFDVYDKTMSKLFLNRTES